MDFLNHLLPTLAGAAVPLLGSLFGAGISHKHLMGNSHEAESYRSRLRNHLAGLNRRPMERHNQEGGVVSVKPPAKAKSRRGTSKKTINQRLAELL